MAAPVFIVIATRRCWGSSELPVLDSNEDLRNQTPASYQLDEQAVAAPAGLEPALLDRQSRVFTHGPRRRWLVLIVAEKPIQIFRPHALEFSFKFDAIPPVVWLSSFLSLSRVRLGEIRHIRRSQCSLLREVQVATLRFLVRSAAFSRTQCVSPSRTPPGAACAPRRSSRLARP